ncbi:MAG: WD40 repeat domain-containing protein, partial [Actinobacteria bacterium]|nr:WD40 repeat domain-containing protein [Actinomycetota bacterium]
GPPGTGTLDLTTLAPQPGFLSVATASEQAGFDADHVVRLVVTLGSSGAVDDLTWSPGRSVGMVASASPQSVTIFDADQDLVLGTIPIFGDTLGDCAIDPSRGLGFVTDFSFQVWVIDLEATPPVLASGINPILISNNGEDLSLSPDRRFLAVSDGSAVVPLSIVDVATRLEVGTVFPTSDCNSVDFCSDDSLVGTSDNQNQLIGFSLANDGTPSIDDLEGFLDPNNVTCAPGGLVGVAISRFPGSLRSFVVDGLVTVETRALPDFGLSACFSGNGQRLFARMQFSVEAWSFDPLTGSLGAAPLYSIPADFLETFYGMDRVVLHPDGSRLYVPGTGAVRIHAPNNGALLDTIPIATLQSAGGIAVERGLR